MSAGDATCAFFSSHLEGITDHLFTARTGDETTAQCHIVGQHVLDPAVCVFDVLAHDGQVDRDAFGEAEGRQRGQQVLPFAEALGHRGVARREAFETYVKRLEGLEKIASSYRGVERVFAIQAGREIRVVVTPEQVDDTRMTALSEEIARRIESELQYPGQIKVVVIRESRAVDFAR